MATAIASRNGPTTSSRHRVSDDVERALEQARGARQAEPPDAEHRHAVDVVELDGRTDHLEHPRQHADAHPHCLGGADEVDDAVVSVVVGAMMIRCTLRSWTTRRSSCGHRHPVAVVDRRGPASAAPRPRRARARLAASFWRTRSTRSASPMTRHRSAGAVRPATARAIIRPLKIGSERDHPQHRDLCPPGSSCDGSIEIEMPTPSANRPVSCTSVGSLVERRMDDAQVVAVVEPGHLEQDEDEDDRHRER